MAKATKAKDWQTEPRKPRKWTVMVYMAADMGAELDATAVQDLREMERGANGSAHIVVHINRAWPDSVQRYEVRKSKKDPRRGHSALVFSDEDTTDMGEQGTLEDFLRWAPGIFPAERYFLVLWGHAYGLGFGRDHNNELTLKELQASLEAFRGARNEMLKDYPDLKRNLESDGRLELLGTNACAMSYVEAAYQLRRGAQYLVASQISVPFAGWPYESILRFLPNTTEPPDLGRLVVDLYVEHYNSLIGGERVAMSLLNLQSLDKRDRKASLKDLIEHFANEVRKVTSLKGRLGGGGRGPVRDVFIAASAGDVRPLIDLRDLCQDFREFESEALKNAATDVQTFLDTVIVHHAQHPDLEDLKGIGIFAPFVTDEQDLKRLQLLASDNNGGANGKAKRVELTGQEEYEQLDVFGGAAASWPRLVYDDLRQEMSPELASCIISIDATSVDDRRDVTQIILSIDSTFNKLDRVLTNARSHVDLCLRSSAGTTTNTVPTGNGSNGGARRFGLPWLKLIQPVDVDEQLRALRQRALEELRRASGAAPVDIAAAAMAVTAGNAPASYLERALAGSVPSQAPSRRLTDDAELVDNVVGFFAKVEEAIAEVERATRRGLTHPRLGLGPTFPGQFGPDHPPKQGLGPDHPPKQGLGPDHPPKQGLGDSPFENRINGGAVANGDLRIDLALTRVAGLFEQVGQSLIALERATLEVETTARTVLAEAQSSDMTPKDLVDAASEEIGRAFRILEEASANARRTIRRVLGHPLYGIGPGGTGLGVEEQQSLASSGGLDRRNLRLL